jgi:pilus assembly protein Flp/PilA
MRKIRTGTVEVDMAFSFVAKARRFLKDESGLSAVEYGLLAAGIVVAIYATIGNVGTALKDIYTSIVTDLTTG